MHKAPSSSFSTASTEHEVSMDNTSDEADREIEKFQAKKRDWRKNEFQQLLNRETDKHRLHCFDLATSGISSSAVQSTSPRAETPITREKLWEIGLDEILNKGPAKVACDLSQRSLEKLQQIPYGNFVQKALDLPSDQIKTSLWTYEVLDAKLYFDLIKSPQHLNQLHDLKQSLAKLKSDPLIYATIEYTWQEASRVVLQCPAYEGLNGTGVGGLAFRLEATLDKFITRPLQEVLERADSAERLLQDFQVLGIRLHDSLRPLEADWSTPLNNRNDFLEQLRWNDVPALASLISRKDMALFRDYVPIAFTKDGAQARSILSSRWNQLMVEVKECMAAGIGLESKIDGLAQALHTTCNYYSLTAVVQGIQASGLQTECSRKYGKLIDPTGGYQAYRSGMGGSHALHFLLPALSAFARKDLTYAEVVTRDLSLYIETHRCPEDSPVRFSFLAIFTACFRC
ncbi:hypothetical protein N7481_008470 [Penicillium waksmanii]|uniref:uncharacterized protein n=1 Tax=Penicillium waksmanii TaxID=69791 RepID=UPI002548BC4E|nr:uncharacterized protein N7481_008470 [Penicillium waksmanii]KAJ5974763.1 hypothetical protein N7481_008470 [Penicillium waksmanii]